MSYPSQRDFRGLNGLGAKQNVSGLRSAGFSVDFISEKLKVAYNTNTRITVEAFNHQDKISPHYHEIILVISPTTNSS
jgi:hypothetical protein